MESDSSHIGVRRIERKSLGMNNTAGLYIHTRTVHERIPMLFYYGCITDGKMNVKNVKLIAGLSSAD